MSHKLYKLNSISPDADNNISAAIGTGNVIFEFRPTYLLSLNLGFSTYGPNNNTPFYFRSTYASWTLGTGVSLARSSYYPLTATVYWYDEITLPQGEYEMFHNFSGSSTGTQTGKGAWVNNDTSARIGPVISTRDAHRNACSRFTFSAGAGGIKLGFRILESSVAYHTYYGFRATSIIIIDRS